MREKIKLFIGLPTGFGSVEPSTATWLFMFGMQLAGDPRVDMPTIQISNRQDPRIAQVRNQFAHDAIRGGYTHLLMVDPDMHPDLFWRDTSQPEQFSFWDTAVRFLQDDCPARDIDPDKVVIGAPACAARPHRAVNVWVFDGEGSSRRCTQAEAKQNFHNPSFMQVSAIGTGMILIPVALFKDLPQPFFRDVYEDESGSKLKYSQDVYFTGINCHRHGIKTFCNWYAWAGHVKKEELGVPDGEIEEAPEVLIQEPAPLAEDMLCLV